MTSNPKDCTCRGKCCDRCRGYIEQRGYLYHDELNCPCHAAPKSVEAEIEKILKKHGYLRGYKWQETAASAIKDILKVHSDFLTTIIGEIDAKVQDDLDAGKFGQICSNETTFKDYIRAPIRQRLEK
jgi:hypothetical protein